MSPYIWDFLGDMFSRAIQAMKDVDFVFGISLWNWGLIVLALSGIGFILGVIFNSNKKSSEGGSSVD